MPREVRVIRPPPPRAPRQDRPPMRDERGRDFRVEAEARRVEDVVPFVVTWGGRDGADPRRVLAMVCRRGDITRREIGAIHILPTHTIVEVVRGAADHFLRHAGQPDPRDRRVRIEPYAARDEGPRGAGQRPPPRRR
ncbi:MAG: DbpA RNA binding domain-containing protein [Deltaproteobacteria bacterium]